MKSIVLIASLIIVNTICMGQTNEFTKLSDEMFFNIFAYKPDSMVYDFVKKYYPMFTKAPEKGGWTAYPPGAVPVFISTMHSFIFTKHPFFDAKFKEGRLDILSNEEKGELPGVTDFRIWFFFDNKKDAESAFDKLCHMFEKVSKSKKILNKTDKEIAQYSSEKKMTDSNSVEFILTKDELYDGKYKILFRDGAFTYSNP